MMNYIKKFIRFNINKKRSNIDKTIKFNNTLLNRTNLTYFIRSFGNKNKNKTFYVIQMIPLRTETFCSYNVFP